MKAEKKRGGMLRGMFSILTHNWGLKLLALVLAIIVYHSLKPDIGFTQESNDRHIFQPDRPQE